MKTLMSQVAEMTLVMEEAGLVLNTPAQLKQWLQDCFDGKNPPPVLARIDGKINFLSCEEPIETPTRRVRK